MDQLAVSKIAGVGHFVPDNIVLSSDLMEAFDSEHRFGLPARYLATLVGVQERRWADHGSMPSSLAIRASERAICNAGISANEIDFVLYCGIERDWQEPATSHRIQHEIGAVNATCLDLTNACHGFMNGLSFADAYIASGNAQTFLVCTAEIGSRLSRAALARLQSPDTTKDQLRRLLGALTIGDAGAAMVIQRSSNDSGFKKFKFESAGQHTELCHYTSAANDEFHGQMLMEAICKETLSFHTNVMASTYQSLQWHASDVDRLYAHQVGTRVHRSVCQLTGVSPDRAPSIVERFGNIASATIPVLFSLYPPAKGDKVLIISSGSGMTIGQSALVA